MAHINTNVVTINSAKENQTNLDKNFRKAVVMECGKLLQTRLHELSDYFFEKLDDELFMLSEKGINSIVQTLYFDAMRYTRIERSNIKRDLIANIASQFGSFCDPESQLKKVVIDREISEDDLELLDEERLEEDLAVSTMGTKGTNQFNKSLYHFNSRLCALVARQNVDPEDNPLAPSQVSHAFGMVMKPVELQLSVKLVIYKLFDALVINQLGVFYDELNTHLVNRGIIPDVVKTGVRSGIIAPNPGSGTPIDSALRVNDNLNDLNVEQNNRSAFQFFQAMQSQLQNWRTQRGITALSNSDSNSENSTATYHTQEVIQALSQFQINDPNRGSVGGTIKIVVADELNTIHSSGQPRTLARTQEDTIDMVDMVFAFILDDRNLPDSVKALIARLQIPIVKLAIMDNSFFSKKKHPARHLLNQLAKTGEGLDGEGCKSSPTFNEIERIVNRILTEFEQDLSLFVELVEEFNAFTEKDEQRTRITEQRTRQVAQSKEQLTAAKTKCSREILTRFQGKCIPATIREFLKNAWNDLLILLYLRKEKDSEQWDKALSVVDRLLWTSSTPAHLEDKNQRLQMVPGLLNEIRAGLETIAYDPYQISQILKDLEACHIKSLNNVAEVPPSVKRLASQSHQPPPLNPRERSEGSDRKVKDPVLEAEINNLISELPDIEREPYGPQAGSEAASAKHPDEINDEFTHQAKAMPIGQWIEITEQNDKKTRAKLSWKSRVTQLYVFVNRKGVKIAEKPLQQLAAELRSGAISTIENTETPLMDRALSALMRTLDPEKQQNQGCPVPA